MVTFGRMDGSEFGCRSVAAHKAWGPDGDAGEWRSSALAHVVDNMTTHALDRHVCIAADGSSRSLIRKTLHPASESPYFAMIPKEQWAPTLVALNWLDEPRVYRSGLAAGLPDPLRMPVVYAIEEASNRISIWMEDVHDASPWDLDRYRRTAVALGRMSGTWNVSRATDALGLGPRPIGDLFFGKVVHFDLLVQGDDNFWSHPSIAAAVDDSHRHDLYELAARMPALIGALDALPMVLCHGDASPGNFLEPGDGTIVAIDWAFGSIGESGSDLAQLLAGRFESGAADVDELADTANAIVAGFHDGLVSCGLEVSPAMVERAWATHLAIRSVFSALLVDHLIGVAEEERERVLRSRVALARFGLDAALRLR